MNKTTDAQQTKTVPFFPSAQGISQRKCACGNHTIGGECKECSKKEQTLQHTSPRGKGIGSAEEVPPIVHKVLRLPARPLNPATSAFMQPRFEHDFSGVPVQISAHLPGLLPDDDPIHRPIIEGYRREHGLPAGGVDESGQRVGPSDAEIKYGGLVTRGASIFYVNFQNAMPPGAPDHSQQHPGPSGATANRAGYTRVRLRKQMNIPWDTGAAQGNGRVRLFAQSVNVFYRLDPIEVYVSSDYAEGSCPYRVTLQHERTHIRAFLRLFHSARESLINLLEHGDVPTRDAPRLVEPGDVEAVKDTIGEQLRQVILSHSAALVRRMEADRDAKDAPSAYAALHAKCPASEW